MAMLACWRTLRREEGAMTPLAKVVVALLLSPSLWPPRRQPTRIGRWGVVGFAAGGPNRCHRSHRCRRYRPGSASSSTSSISRAPAAVPRPECSPLPRPSMAEAGIDGQEADTLTATLAPAGTAKAIINRCTRRSSPLAALPDVQQRRDELGSRSWPSHRPIFAGRINTEGEKWADVVRDAKIKPQDAK